MAKQDNNKNDKHKKGDKNDNSSSQSCQDNAALMNTLNNFNSMINYANSTFTSVNTSPEQKKQNKLNRLKQRYLDAEVNLAKAPSEVEERFKKYMVYKDGEPAYNIYITKKLEEKAKVAANKFRNGFIEEAEVVANEINSYEGLLINFNNVVELYKKYKEENVALEKKLKTLSADTITNDRKTYYEDQGIDYLLSWYTFFIIVYIIGLIILTICLFVFPSKITTIQMKILVIILFVIYPFICIIVFHKLYKFYTDTKAFLPKNVYKTLDD